MKEKMKRNHKIALKLLQKLYHKESYIARKKDSSRSILSRKVKRSQRRFLLCAFTPLLLCLFPFLFSPLCSFFVLNPQRRSFKRPISPYSPSRSLSFVSFYLTYSSHNFPLRRANGEFRGLLNCNNFN